MAQPLESDSLLSRMTTFELEQDPSQTLLIPLGSTEQHGPHLPLGTDTTIAQTWCDLLASGRPDVVVAPALPYGSAGEHQEFSGTLSIGSEALSLVLVELARSASLRFNRLVFVSGHAGNAATLSKVIKQLRQEGHTVSALVPVLAGADAHAGRFETSMMLAIDADSVRVELAEVGNVTPLTELMPALRQLGLRPVSSNGILGDPTGASAQEGRDLLSTLAAVSIDDDGLC